MKKIIALIAMAGLITVGCSHFRHKESNTGGTSDTTQMNTGSSSSDKTSSSTSSQNSQSTSDSSSSNPSDKTPK